MDRAVVLNRIARNALAVAAMTMAVPAAWSQSPEQFYAGHPLNLVVGGAAGSGYDVIGRLVAAHLGKYLPGNPKVIVRDMPGAGGITATNYMYSVAEKDGSTIAVVAREAMTDPIFSGADSKALYDSRRFVFLGTPNREVGMAYAMMASGVKTIEDVRQREVTAAASGATSGSAVAARLVNALVGTRFKIINGYPGGMEAMLAMAAGEADARVVTGYAGPEAIRANGWVKEGKAVLLLQLAVRKHPSYPQVPLILDFAKTDQDRKLMQLIFIGQEIGRPFFAPPGIPADRAKALQEAFAKEMDDPDFRQEAKDYELSPLLAADLQNVVEQIYSAPEDLIAKAIAITAGIQK